MNRHIFTFLFLFLFSCFSVQAQDLIERALMGIAHVDPANVQVDNGLFNTLQNKKQATNNRTTKSYPLFKLTNQKHALPRTISKGIQLDLDEAVLEQLRKQNSDLLTLTIPVNESKAFEIELFQVDIYADGYNVITSTPTSQALRPTGIFYHGIIKGNANSAVAVSLFENVVDVFIQDSKGNYKISKSDNLYTLYNGHYRTNKKKYPCKTSDLQDDIAPENQGGQARNSQNSEVGIYVEADYDLFLAKDEDVNTVNTFMEVLINETIALYARLNIPIKITQLKIFNTRDPYPQTDNSTPKLDVFSTTIGDDFPGHLAHLITGSFGGGQAQLGVLCAKPYATDPELAGPFAVSGIGELESEMPDLDDINTFVHELGHNFGAPHTQSCSWNGNNTAIDGCVEPEEDEDDEGNAITCDRPSTECPTGGGTIMSYCSTPDDPIEDCVANNNWHPQVADLIKMNYQESLADGCFESDDTDNGDDMNMADTPLDMEILSQMETQHIPSLSIGVLSCKALSWSKSYGNYDIPNQKQATENTIYTLASLTKVVTATAVFHLMESGAFQLDEDINKYLPYDITHPDYPSTPITFRMLLQHTSGIIDNDLIYEGYSTGDHPESLADFIFKYLNPDGDNYEVFENFSDNQPGKVEAYSNTGITLLGYLVEVISETPFNEYCNRNLFTPMEMNNTRFFLSELNGSNVAIPYTWEGQSYETEGQYGFPDYPNGLLRSTVKDLSNFFGMYLNNGSYKGQQILTAQSIELLTPSNSDQGHTWFESSDIIPSGNRSWGHSGLESGTVTIGVLDHNTDAAVIMLTNGSDLEDLNELTFWNELWQLTSDCNATTTDVDQDGFDNMVDCNDNNAQINPNQTEIPYNGIDDDCNPNTLDDDLDQDGFGMATDCDDANAAINPNATDIADNGIDEDCNGEDHTMVDDDDDTRGGNGTSGTTPETCDCQLDTAGLAAYINTLDFDENDPLVFDVPSASSKFGVLYGTISSNTPERAERLVSDFPNVTTLIFLSIPGSGDDDANLRAARVLRNKGYTSYLPAVQAYPLDAFIASGGVDLFLSGTTRIIDEGAEVGVHSWAGDDGKVATDFPNDDPVHQSYIDYYVEMGFSTADASAFYFFTINAAPAESIYNMMEGEIEQYKMRTCKRPDSCDDETGGDGDGDGGDETDGGDDGNDMNDDNEKAAWTYLVYLNGSDLEQEEKGNSGTNDIAEMTAAGSTENVNVIITTGGTNKPGWREIKRWKIENGQQVPIEFSAADNDMANTQNLTDFINWAIATYPAEKYVLDLWNHGMDIRGYGHDENTDQEMKIPALQQAIANADFVKAGNRFEIIGFDACLMATIEVQNTVQNFANYFVGSEETEPGHGWDYTPIIQAMESQSVNDGAALGKVIADNFFAQAKDMETNNVTLSVTDLAQTNALIGALEDLTNAIRLGGDEMLRKVQEARSKAEEYSKSLQNPAQSEDMVDIGDMMKKLRQTAPELSSQTAGVLSVLNQAVTYNVKDNTRPNATGISMFWPHNKLVDEDAVNQSFEVDYDPIDFSTAIKSFMKNDYAKNAMADNTPPDGDFYEYDEGTLRGGTASSGRLPNRWSAVRIPDSEDLEQVQVVLSSTTALEEGGIAGDVLLLGATLPDVEEPMADGSGTIYAYEWDGSWLGINGFPAYIADIFEYGIDNDDGTETYYTRVKVLAVLNPDEDGFGQDIIISYFRQGDEADFEVESIVPETYGDNVMLTAKERISLKPGDRVQLLYEGFNPVIDEDFYAIDDAAIFTIENGNQDLELGYDLLDYGDYTLGFQLLDYAQNDTILFDPNPFVLSTSTDETFADNNIEMFPNPAKNSVRINYPDYAGKTYQIQITNLNGQLVSKRILANSTVDLDISAIASGFYFVRLVTAEKIFSDKLVIQK